MHTTGRSISCHTKTRMKRKGYSISRGWQCKRVGTRERLLSRTLLCTNSVYAGHYAQNCESLKKKTIRHRASSNDILSGVVSISMSETPLCNVSKMSSIEGLALGVRSQHSTINFHNSSSSPLSTTLFSVGLLGFLPFATFNTTSCGCLI